MHPSPAALMTMTDAELGDYRAELRELAIDTDETFNGPYRTRVALIDAIMDDRKYAADVLEDLRGENA
jgi:hypothetical protein